MNRNVHPVPADSTEVDDLIEADPLVEEVSIDGMCGVY
ncbi:MULTISPECIES: mycofactocin precursor MftA [unclassified Salinibacterium]|nr:MULTISPECIES: mycofactocin precursor MftA [unclassified Salinibacterium]